METGKTEHGESIYESTPFSVILFIVFQTT